MATFDQFIKSIIADGNDGKAFEKFCKHFLETSPEYAHQFEKVWLWDDWPNKWSHDKGIDLVAKYKGRDRYCAVQAKCYAAHNTVPYNEVTNFLADSSRTEIEDRILMMSTNKLNEKTSKEVISGQEKQVTILDRDYFENKAKFDYPSHISELGKAKAKPPAIPRKHQITAINDVEKGLQENDRGQLIMACGTGKTFTTLWIKERLKANTVLVLLPSLSLLSQTMREWVWGANERFEALAVCSDPTVGKSKNTDEDISTAEVGKVTWHVNEIQAFLKTPNPKVIFCTYQSSELIQIAQEGENIPQFDLVVCDEAHRCAGKANAGFATVLHEEKIRAKKRLFTTATPRYYGKSVHSAAEGRGVEIIGMDDETKFGPVVHKLTFGQAIEMDMLTDYQVVVVGVDEPMVREWIAEGEIVSYGDENHTDARTLAAKIAVLKAIKDYDLTRIISFHTSIKRAKDFASDVFDVADIINPEQRPMGNIWSQHVDGTMSAGKRRDLINGLKELDGYDVGLLTNARCLSEGVDVPTLDGVAFVDPRGSQVDIIQAVGRAIRKSDNKTKGTIVLPVFLEAGDDPDTVIDASNFKPVWDVLKALRAHDEVLADEIDSYRRQSGLSRTKTAKEISKIILDLPINVSEEFSGAIQTQIIENSSSNFEFWFGLLTNFKEREGHCRVPPTQIENGHKLGDWVRDIRSKMKTRGMATDRKQRLEALDFSFSPHEDDWNIAYEKLYMFFENHGHSNVPFDYSIGELNLGSWVSAQRAKYAKLSAERRRKLVKLGFVKNAFEAKWELKFLALEQFYKREGHFKIPNDHLENGENIKVWLEIQRTNFKRSKLKIEYQQKLISLGVALDPHEANWTQGFYQLQNFYQKFGHTNIKYDFVMDDFKLGQWVGSVRSRKKSLSYDRLQKLNSLEFVWNARDQNWEDGFSCLRDYYLREGHFNVPQKHKENGFSLGSWLQGIKRRREKLSVARKERLMQLGLKL
jgi:superfamily II DNA or RNA helicase